jgi:hypothetical protein
VQPTTISTLSLEFVRVRVDATESGTRVDPTAQTVTMAFKSGGADPAGGDFKTASWETDDSDPYHPVYYARCLVGPAGAATLTPGTYKAWVKIVDTPEVPVIEAPGRLVVT